MVYRVMGEEPPAPGAGRGGPGPGPAGRGEGAVRGEGGGGRGEGHGGRGASAATADATGESRPHTIGLDAAITRAMAAATDWNILTVRVPASDRAPISFSVDRGDGGQPQARATLTVDAATGAITQTNDFSAQTPGRRMRTILRFAHTGEILGLIGQTVAGLVSAGGAVLVYTGVSLALRRLVAWTRRRATARADRTAAASQSPAA
jgi:uncharacterized iron-regulated membrane protein